MNILHNKYFSDNFQGQFSSVLDKILLGLFFFLVCNNLFSQNKQIIGNKAIPTSVIQEVLSKYSKDSLIENLSKPYFDIGYFSVQFIIDSNEVIVNEGDQFILSDIIIEPDSIIKFIPNSINRIHDLLGSNYSTNTLKSIINSILNELDLRMFPLVQGYLNGIDFTDNLKLADSIKGKNKCKIGLIFENIKKVNISELNFIGLKETSEKLLRVASGISENDYYNSAVGEKIKRRISGLNVFSNVGDPELYYINSDIDSTRKDTLMSKDKKSASIIANESSNASTKYGLQLKVTENNSNSFDGIIGLVPDANSNEPIKIFGSIKIGLKNISGTGRNLSAKWEKLQNNSSELSAEYHEPFIFTLPFDFNLSYSQTQYPSTNFLTSYVQRYINSWGEFYAFDNLICKLGIGYEQSLPQPDTTRVCFEQLIKTSAYYGEVAAKYDTRNSRINPITGVYYNTSLTFGIKSLNQTESCYDSTIIGSYQRQKVDVNLQLYQKIFKPIIGVITFNFSSVISDQIQESDLYKFGGQSTVRGYRESQFRADRMAWSNAELRLPLNEFSYFGLFFDLGYFLKNGSVKSNIDKIENYIFGYGLSSQLETPIGIVKVSFALSKDDKFDSGKIFLDY